MPVIFSLLFLGILVPLATALSFHFPTFDQSSLSNITLKGDASLSPNGCIQLTKDVREENIGSSVGRAVYNEPFLLWNDAENQTDFHTHFTFIINMIDPMPADGMAFFLSPNSSGSTIYPTHGGCGLGVFNDSVCLYGTDSNFSEPIVAVEFDTFPNIYDPRYPHVGIDVGSARSVMYQIWGDDGNSNDSKWQGETWVSYDSGTHNLSVFLTIEHGNRTTNYSLSHIVDLREVLNSSEVAVGFSAATGARDELHQLLSWEFSSTLVDPPMQLHPVQAPMQLPPVQSTGQRKRKMGIIVGMVMLAISTLT